jgi:hypothetical protein
MRLLKQDADGNITLTPKLLPKNIPAYAILSHTWEDDEPTFDDFRTGSILTKKSYRKTVFCGSQAAKDGLQYFWYYNMF